MNIFRELWRNKTLVWKLGKNDFKTKYAGSYFGILWAFVQPMVTILIYIFIFQFGFRVMDTPNGYPYALWLIAGIIPWFFFSEGIINATNCCTFVFYCICDFYLYYYGKDTDCSDGSAWLLYTLRNLSNYCDCLFYLFHRTVFQRFWNDYQYPDAGWYVGMPDYVGYVNV